MKNLQEILKDQYPVTENSDNETDNVELTDEEKNIALEDARQKKAAKLKEIAYWEKVKKSREIFIPSSEEFLIGILDSNPEMTIDDQNEDIFVLLQQYFTGDKKFEEGGLSLKKGIMLAGPVGCGKTTFMRIFKRNIFNPYVFISSRKIADEYSIDGEESFMPYIGTRSCSPREWYGHDQLGLCIDDLGAEGSKKHFGNQANVMEDIILARYENRSLTGKTHFTTNLTADQIGELYGSRVRSRLREMVNFISFDPNANDRRI